MNPRLEGLARYVAQELERGVPEITLYAALRQSGWTVDWINAAFSTAKQHVMQSANQLDMPAVQTRLQPQQPMHATASRQLPEAPRTPKPQPRRTTKKRTFNVTLILTILVIALAIVATGLGVYRGVQALNRAAEQRILRDADRREDLSVFLSDLSDYYVVHKSYPTRDQLGDVAFRERNGFDADSVTDPKWADNLRDCTSDRQPALSAEPTPGCYAYEVRPEGGRSCDNEGRPCTKVTITIPLETGEKSYAVTLNKNTQAE
jgi:hypothetical protein